LCACLSISTHARFITQLELESKLRQEKKIRGNSLPKEVFISFVKKESELLVDNLASPPSYGRRSKVIHFQDAPSILRANTTTIVGRIA